VLSWLRVGRSGEVVLVVCNFTPIPRDGYLVGVPHGGAWKELLNSDSEAYGGSGIGNLGRVEARDQLCHGRPWSLSLALPPLAVLYFTPEKEQPA
jgi:1,4-alpha-glucan branching enzyme